MAIHTTKSLFLLEYKEGAEERFTVLQEIDGLANDGIWFDTAYMYTLNNKIHITIDQYHKVVSYIPSGRFIVNYIPSQNCLYCIDCKVGESQGVERSTTSLAIR